MATSAPTFYGVVREGSDAEFRWTMSNGAGIALQQADVFAIDLVVYQGNTTTAVYTAPGGTYTPASVIVPGAPQTDGWTLGGDGYTCKANVPHAAVSMNGGELYRYEWKFTLTSAATPKPVAFALFVVTCAPLSSQ